MSKRDFLSVFYTSTVDNATYFVKSASKPLEHTSNDTINASKCPNWNKNNWSQKLEQFDRDSISFTTNVSVKQMSVSMWGFGDYTNLLWWNDINN